jgi:hypothetical protein
MILMLTPLMAFPVQYDKDGVIPFGVDLTCKTPGRTMTAFEVKPVIQRVSGVSDTLSVARVTVSNTATSGDYSITIARGERVAIASRIIETVGAIEIVGDWTQFSEFVEYVVPSSGCSKPWYKG